MTRGSLGGAAASLEAGERYIPKCVKCRNWPKQFRRQAVGGSDIPVEAFVKAFNDGAKAFSKAAKPVGSIGAGTPTPEVGVTTDGSRYSITISAGHGNLGFAAREGTVGGNQGMRIGSVTFSGVYGDV